MKLYNENGKRIINENIPHPGIATVLACIVPGLGHIYTGNVARGAWVFISTTILMGLCVWLGVIEYLWQIFDAYNQAS